jgi:hypothetical protein
MDWAGLALAIERNDSTYPVQTSGVHKVRYGDATSTTPGKTGDGTFTDIIVSTGTESLAGLVGDVDFNATITDVSIREAGVLGEPIEFGALTSFQPYGVHGQYMRTSYIRTIGITRGILALNIKAVYDYKISEEVANPVPNTAGGTNTWDFAQWDLDLWDFTLEANSVPIGASGWGRTMAVAMRGSSDSRITVIGWDVMFNNGGLL